MNLQPSSLVRLVASFPRHAALVGRLGHVVCVHDATDLVEIRFGASRTARATTALVAASHLEVLREARRDVAAEQPFAVRASVRIELRVAAT